MCGVRQWPPQSSTLLGTRRLPEQREIRKKEIAVVMPFDPAPVYGQLVRLEHVIRAEPVDPIAAGIRETDIESRSHATVGLIDAANTAIPPDVGFRDLGSTVGRAVVNNDCFPIGIGLRQHTLERLRKKGFLIVGGNDDRRERLIHGTALLAVSIGA